VARTVSINFYDPEVIADPWPAFAEVARAGRVVWNDALRVWTVHRYHDVARVLTETAHFSSTAHRRANPWVSDSMISVDPPDHHRLRNPLQGAFTKRELSRWEEHIGGLIDGLFDSFVEEVSPGAPIDVVDRFIWHIPSVVIAEMMGIPPDARDDFHRWTVDMVTGVGATVDPSAYGKVKLAIAQQASTRMHAFLGEEIARRQAHPTGDLLGLVVRANVDGAMSDDELTETAVLLLQAGNDTTAKLLAQCLVKLHASPDQQRLVAQHLALIPDAIEEVLRFEQLSQSIPRVVRDGPVSFGEDEVPDDAIVWAMTSMANRDPEVFDRPDVLDVTRARKAPHLGFGYGAHLCLGANLARMEVRMGLERLLGRFPDYEIAGFELSKGWSVRGPEHIDFVGDPVRLAV
jgi:cytochrome P450